MEKQELYERMQAEWRPGMEPATILKACVEVAWRELGAPPEGWPPGTDIQGGVLPIGVGDNLRWTVGPRQAVISTPERLTFGEIEEDVRRAAWGVYGRLVVVGPAREDETTDALTAAEEDAQELAEVLALLDREQVPREDGAGRPLTPSARLQALLTRQARAARRGAEENHKEWAVDRREREGLVHALAELGHHTRKLRRQK